MAVTIAQIINLIQDGNRLITGVNYAPYLEEYHNAEISSADLPAVIVEDDGGVFIPDAASHVGATYGQLDRTFTLKCLVRPQNYAGNPESEVLTLITAMLKYWGNSNNWILETTPFIWVNMDNGLRDTGYQPNLDWANAFYHGFELTIRVYAKDIGV